MKRSVREGPAVEPGLFALGLMMGAGLMYLLDPDRGRRRRALLRDRFVHGANEAERLGGSTASSARHIRNRTRGLLAERRAGLREEQVEDSVLEGRLRAELGRLVQPVGDLRAEVLDGVVRLTGTIDEADEPRIVRGLRRVPGVRDLHSQLRHRPASG